MIDEQMLFNLIITLVSFLVGWFLKLIWSAYQKIHAVLDKVDDRLIVVELKLASETVSPKDLTVCKEKCSIKFGKVFDKIDNKADK